MQTAPTSNQTSLAHVIHLCFALLGSLLILVGFAASLRAGLPPLGLDFRGGLILRYRLVDVRPEQTDTACEQAVDTIHRRLNEYGITDVSVIRSQSAVAVQLGGSQSSDVESIRAIIERNDRLEFFHVDETVDPFPGQEQLPPGLERRTEASTSPSRRTSYVVASGPDARSQLELFCQSISAPPGRRLAIGPLPSYQADEWERPVAGQHRVAWRSYLLDQQSALGGDHIAAASTSYEERDGRPYVSITFDAEGRERFAELTAEIRGDRLAIVLNDVVTSAPVVQERIGGGQARITLGAAGSREELITEAQDLVVSLRSGALPAPLVLESESLIAPTYGSGTVMMMAIATLLLLGLCALVVLLRQGLAGLPVAASLFLCVMVAVELFVLADAVFTLYSGVAILIACLICGSSGLVIIEAARRAVRRGFVQQSARLRGWRALLVIVVPVHLGLLLLTAILVEALTGPPKGFVAGLLLASFASIVVVPLVSTVGLGWVRPAGSPPGSSPSTRTT